MPITQQELDQFNRFVQTQLSSAEPPESLQECLIKWRAEREREETIQAVRQSEAELDAGLGVPLEEAAVQLRRELTWYGRTT